MHFSSPDLIVQNLLKDKLWNSSDLPGIVIENHTVYRQALTETRPAIIHKRHTWKQVNLGIDNRFMPGEVTGENHYANYWQGSHTLFCIGGSAGEAELLGTEVFQELNEQGRAVRFYTNLLKFEVAQIGEIGKLEEAGQKFVVPITVGYVIEEAWRLKQDAPFFKRIDLNIMF